MTKTWIPLVLGAILLAAPARAAAPAVPATEKEKKSYSMGVDVGRNFKRLGIDVDLDMVVRGLRDGYAGGKLQLSEEEMRSIGAAFQAEMRQKQIEAVKAWSEENRKKGAAFLAENGKKEGVVTLPSGLQYRILKAGEGKKPGDEDTVEVSFSGALVDGTEFVNSAKAGKTASFKVGGGVIPGWAEALKLMPVGSKWQLFIPPQLAYGEAGAGRDIGPNATLVFELELIAIK
jgi:FKBP-type peptidyl-prolyl cis-trans isomerase FklB